MFPYLSKVEMILSELDDRRQAVLDHCQNMSKYVMKSFNIPMYEHLIYYVQYIIDIQEIEGILDVVLQKKIEIRKKHEDLIKVTQQCLHMFGNRVINSNEFAMLDTFEQTIIKKLLNVSLLDMPSIEMVNFKNILIKNNNFALNLTSNIKKTNLELIEKVTNNFSQCVNVIKREDTYAGVGYVEFIFALYYITDPLNNEPPDSLKSYVNYFREKNTDFSTDEIKAAINGIYSLVKSNLNTSLAKQTIIEKFIGYMELYKAKNYQDEKKIYEEDLQKEFEQFLFINGFYPIVHPKLSNGIPDIIVENERFSLLFEIKQIGIVPSEKNKPQIHKKFVQVLNQMPIYHKRLANMPKFLKDVYVITFSSNPIRFTKDKIMLDSLTYHFYFINFCLEAPQKQTAKNFDPIKLIEYDC